MRAKNQPHDTEAFLDWRREIGASAMYLRENTGKLCRQITEGPRWGEAALEALLYTAGSAQSHVRRAACEALVSFLETPETETSQAISTTARTAILWALEDALRDTDQWISRLARVSLRRHLVEEQTQARRLFPSLASHDHGERAAALRALHSLPVPLMSQVYQNDADQLTDCLRLCKIPAMPLVLDRNACLVTSGGIGKSDELKTFLVGLASTNCGDQIRIAVVTSDENCKAVAAQHEALLISVEAISPDVAQDGHGLIFSIAHIINTEKYLCVHPCFSNYRYLWTILDSLNALDENSLVVCPEGSHPPSSSPYYDPPEAETVKLGGVQLTPNCSALNPALFAGHRNALLALDAAMRHLLPVVPEPATEWRAALFSLAVSTNERTLPLNTEQIRGVPEQGNVYGSL